MLRRWLEGRTVTSARSTTLGPAAAQLVGRTVMAVEARAKHLLLRFDGDLVLHTHMRMTGSWHLYSAGDRWRRPAHQARLVLEAGDRVAVCFNVPVIELLSSRDELVHPSLAGLGPDVLAMPDLDEVRRRARREHPDGARVTIGELLLDQRVVSGIGNIYRSETLHRCGINPWCDAARVSDADLDRLVATASGLMEANVTRGDVARRTFDGRTSSPWVYRRGGQPCRRCGTTIRRGVIGRDARSVYWCPHCQPAPQPA